LANPHCSAIFWIGKKNWIDFDAGELLHGTTREYPL